MADRGRAPAPRVKVVYAFPDQQAIVDVAIEPGMDVQTAVERSGLLKRFPQAAAPLTCAIYGQAVPLTREVRAGDRVEILRPLAIDPKESRRQAARAQKASRRS